MSAVPTQDRKTDPVGFAPTTSWFRAKRSTAELRVKVLQRELRDGMAFASGVYANSTTSRRTERAGLEPAIALSSARFTDVVPAAFAECLVSDELVGERVT